MLLFCMLIKATEALPPDPRRLELRYWSNDDVLVEAWRLAYATPWLRAVLEQCAQQQQQHEQQQLQDQQEQSELEQPPQWAQGITDFINRPPPRHTPLPPPEAPLQLLPPPHDYRERSELWVLFIPLLMLAPYLLLVPAAAAALLSTEPQGSMEREEGRGMLALLAILRPAVPLALMLTPLLANLSVPGNAIQRSGFSKIVSPLDLEPPPPELRWPEWLLFMIGRDIPAPHALPGASPHSE
ncbi:hypothetical protein JKP88DRAFT_287929 [Tribonema minus]|uniref:Uncharacterized protein n=1 Tax=Tribonema minus TaxID=303371 RepID=A0A835Z676_9STRA|nr:hypothetical protein JKP88DRAFT_287929 [Tribonema minus]